jgi:hypothetical protein
MGKQQFKPTHRMQIGTGKNMTYVYVRVVGEAGKKNGEQYYNVIASPDGAITSLPAIPEGGLEKLEESEVLRYIKEAASAREQMQFREIASMIIAEIDDDDITVVAAPDALFQAFMDLNKIPLHFQEWTPERRNRAMKYALKHASPLKAVKQWRQWPCQ